VGEIRARGEPETPTLVTRLPDGSWLVDGLASIDDRIRKIKVTRGS
jgi:hypothetical protein